MLKRLLPLLGLASLSCRTHAGSSDPPEIRRPVAVASSPVAVASSPVAVASSPPRLASRRARDIGQPCEIRVEPIRTASNQQCVVTLARLIPEGEPLELSLDTPVTYRYRYAADGRILESPEYVYGHTDSTSGNRHRKTSQGESEAVEFDLQGRLTRVGSSHKLAYTVDGRTRGRWELENGDWKQVVTYTWGKRESHGVSWTYPDSNEYCVPGPKSVALDQKGRVSKEVYEDCRINYSAFTLKYRYDASGRFASIDVECGDGEKPVTFRLSLDYQC